MGFIKLECLASTIFTAVMKQRQVGHTSREFILIKNVVFLSLRSIKCDWAKRKKIWERDVRLIVYA